MWARVFCSMHAVVLFKQAGSAVDFSLRCSGQVSSSTSMDKGLNNRIEGSHKATRKREKLMGRFKSPKQAQRFLTAHDQINTVFRPRRYQLSAVSYRHARADAFDLWNDYAT